MSTIEWIVGIWAALAIYGIFRYPPKGGVRKFRFFKWRGFDFTKWL